MPRCTELGLLDLSAPSAGISLSTSSYFFSTNDDVSWPTSHSALSRVQAGELRFLPPGVLHIHLVVRFDGCSMNDVPEDSRILEFMAGAICLSNLWDRLGLTAKCTKTMYRTETEEAPNLFLEVEHPDKSASLLAPPGVETSTFEGLLCDFNYQSTSEAQEDIRITQQETQGHTRRQYTVDLATAALYGIVGVRTVFPGVRMGSLSFPSLLELAPTVWSAHYMRASCTSSISYNILLNSLKATADHSRTVPVIANSIAAAGEWSPSLRKKFLALCRNQNDESDTSPGKQPNTSQKSVQRRLWSILDSTLPVTIGMRSAVQKVDRKFKHDAMEELKTYLFPDDSPRELEEGCPEQASLQISEDVLFSEEQYHDAPRS